MLGNKNQKSSLYTQPSIHSYLQPYQQQLSSNQSLQGLGTQFQLRESTRGSLQKALSPVRTSTKKNISIQKQNSKNQFYNSIKEDYNTISSKIATSQSLLKNPSNIYSGLNYDSNKTKPDISYSPYLKSNNLSKNVNSSSQQTKQSTSNLNYLLAKGKDSISVEQKIGEYKPNESKSVEPKSIEIKLTDQKQQESKSLEQRCLSNYQYDSESKEIQKATNDLLNNDMYQTPQTKINQSKQFNQQSSQLYQLKQSNGNLLYSNTGLQKNQGSQNNGAFTPTSLGNICTINLFDNQDILKNFNSSNNKNISDEINSNSNYSISPTSSIQNNKQLSSLNSQLQSNGLTTTLKPNQISSITNQKNTYLGYTRNSQQQNNTNTQLKPIGQQQSQSTDSKSTQQKTKYIDLASQITASKKPITQQQLQQQADIKNSYLNIPNKTDLSTIVSNTFNNNNNNSSLSLTKNLLNGYISTGSNIFQNRASNNDSDIDNNNNNSKYQYLNSTNSIKSSTKPEISNLYSKLVLESQQKTPSSQIIESRGIDSIGRGHDSLGRGNESIGRGVDSIGSGQDSERRNLKLTQQNELSSPTIVQLKSDYSSKFVTSPYKDSRYKLQECDVNSNFNCITCKTKKAKYFIISSTLVHMHFCSKCGIEYVQKQQPSNPNTINSISTGIGGSNTESYLSPAKNTSLPIQTIDLRSQEQLNQSPNILSQQNISSKKNLNDDSLQFQSFSNNKPSTYINKMVPLDKQQKDSYLLVQSIQNAQSLPFNYKIDSKIPNDYLQNYLQDTNPNSTEKSPKNYQYNDLYSQNSTFSQISQYLQNPLQTQNSQNPLYPQNSQQSLNIQNPYNPQQYNTHSSNNTLSNNYLSQNFQYSPQNQSSSQLTDRSVNKKIDELTSNQKQNQVQSDLTVRNDKKDNLLDLTGIYPLSQALQDFKSQISSVFQSSPTQQQTNQNTTFQPDNKQQNQQTHLNQNQNQNLYSIPQNVQSYSNNQFNQQQDNIYLNQNSKQNKDESISQQQKQNQDQTQTQTQTYFVQQNIPSNQEQQQSHQKKLVIHIDGQIGEEERIKRQKLSEFQTRLYKTKDDFESLQKLFQDKNDTSMQDYHKNIEYIENIQRTVIECLNEITSKTKEHLLNNFNENLQKCKKSKFEIQQILNYLNCTENDLISNLDSIIKDMDIDSLKDIIQQYDVVIQQYDDARIQKFINQTFSIYQMKYQNNPSELNICCYKIQEGIQNLLTKVNYTQNIQRNQINSNPSQQFTLQNSFSNQQSKSIYVSFENRDIFQSTANSNSEQNITETQPQSPSFHHPKSPARHQMMQNSIQNAQSSPQSSSQFIQNSPSNVQYKSANVQTQMLSGQNLQQNAQNQNYNLQYPSQNSQSSPQTAQNQSQTSQIELAITKHIFPSGNDITYRQSSFGGDQKSEHSDSPPTTQIKSYNYNYYTPLNNVQKDQKLLQEIENIKKELLQKDFTQKNGLNENSPYSDRQIYDLNENHQSKTLLDKYGMSGKDIIQQKNQDNLYEENYNKIKDIQSLIKQNDSPYNQQQISNQHSTNSSNDHHSLTIKNKQKYNELLQKIQDHQSQTEKLCTDVLSSGNNFKFSSMEENIPSSQNSSQQSVQQSLSKK